MFCFYINKYWGEGNSILCTIRFFIDSIELFYKKLKMLPNECPR